MTDIKLELAPQPALLALDNTRGSTFHGWNVVASVDGGRHAIIRLPDAWSDLEIDTQVRAWAAQGDVVDDGNGLWRYAHGAVYEPLWLRSSVQVQPNTAIATTWQPTWNVGDTFPLIGVTEATRARGQQGAVAVGICDTWVDYAHSWLEGHIAAQWGAARDSEGHGTHVTATAAGAEGIAPEARVYCANVLPDGRGDEVTILNGMRWLADQGCRVINMSLGGTVSAVIDDGVRYAQGKGAIVVAAAGNGGGQPIGSPARVASLIVLACDRTRKPANFTDGRNWSHPNRVYAPGVDIVSAFPQQAQGLSSGTSMAAPHVTGICALLLGAGLSAEDTVGYILDPSHQEAIAQAMIRDVRTMTMGDGVTYPLGMDWQLIQ